MATVADSYSVRRGEEKAPISTHPVFPAIVALWFAALLGLGSLVLPVALFETLVTASGIAALVPPAVPPLGFTARAVIALTGAIAGAALGLLLARKVARSQVPAGTNGIAPGEMREFRPSFAAARHPAGEHLRDRHSKKRRRGVRSVIHVLRQRAIGVAAAADQADRIHVDDQCH